MTHDAPTLPLAVRKLVQNHASELLKTQKFLCDVFQVQDDVAWAMLAYAAVPDGIHGIYPIEIRKKAERLMNGLE